MVSKFSTTLQKILNVVYTQNKKLLAEKEQYMTTLFDQMKEEEAKVCEARKVTRSDVENALFEKLNYVHTSHQEIKGMYCTW